MPERFHIAMAALLTWQAFRPLLILVSLVLLAFSLIFGVRSFFQDERWYGFLLHPSRDGGWFREYRLDVDRGEVDLLVNTEHAADPSARLLGQWTPTPMFAHNAPTPFGSGNLQVSKPHGFGFGYQFLDDRTLPVNYLNAPIGTPNHRYVREWMMPCWALLLLGLGGPIFAVRAWRRVRRQRLFAQGLCTRCGYNLRASIGLCPECGAARLPVPNPIPTRNVQFVVSGGIVLLTFAIAIGAIVEIVRQQRKLREQYQASEDLVSFASGGDTAGVMQALQRGGDPSAFQSAALRVAAGSGQLVAVREIIRHGADVNAAQDAGMTALYRAIENDDDRIAKMLLDAGADIHAPPISEVGIFTVIERSTINFDLLGVLLAHHIDLTRRDGGGCTPLLRAAKIANARPIRMMLEAGADPNAHIQNAEAPDGRTALHLAAAEWAPWNAVDRRSEVLDALITHHADVNARDAAGRTPLHVAVASGSWGMARSLVDAGADLTARDANGKRPIDLIDQVLPEIRAMLTPRETSRPAS